MLSLFDNIYYRFCRFYVSHEKNGGRISALVLLSLTQFIILDAIPTTLGMITTKQVVPFCLICYPLILILNGFRYNKLNYDILHKKWSAKSKKANDRSILATRLYLIFLILLILILINRHILF